MQKALLPALAILLGACEPSVTQCNGITTSLVPGDTILTVGQSFEPRVEESGCTSSVRYLPIERLATEDTAVVSVNDSLVTAVGTGSAIVLVTAGYDNFQLHVRVTD